MCESLAIPGRSPTSPGVSWDLPLWKVDVRLSIMESGDKEKNEAAQALEAAAAAREIAADKVRAPWWYYWGFGLCMTMIIGSFAFGPSWSSPLVAIGGVAMAGLMLVERKNLGVRFNRNRLTQGNRIMMASYTVGALIILAGAVVLHKQTDMPWLIIPGALFLGAWTVWVMYRSDKVLANEYRHGR